MDSSFFFFGPEDAPLFGAVDAPPRGHARDAGVVICPPLARENLGSYRPLRVLAGQLAKSGRPTLRFDWPGVGDSSGAFDDPNLVPAWIAAVGLAAAELRARSFVRSVALVGVGIGGTLAALAIAEGLDVDEVVLWAPETTGRSYLRRMRAFHSLSHEPAAAPSEASASGALESAGFLFSAGTVADLSAINLCNLDFGSGTARRALLLGRDNEQPSTDLVAKLEADGLEVSVAVGRDLDVIISDVTKLPEKAFHSIATWLHAGTPHDTPRAAPVDHATATLELEHGRIDDEIVVLDGRDGRLVCVTTRPHAPTETGDAWVVFLNMGEVRRSGPSRLWTTLARDWATRGIPSLRLDVHGIGDSDGPQTISPNLSSEYSTEVLESIGTALGYLRERHGARRFVPIGICSGAFAAFQSALSDPDVIGAVPINPQVLYWTREEELRVQSSYVRESILYGERWGRVLRGEVNLRRLIGVSGRIVLSWSKRSLARLGSFRSNDADDPIGRQIARDLETLDSRGTRLCFVFADDEPGLGYLSRHLAGGPGRLAQYPDVRLEIVPKAGHTFMPLWSHVLLQRLVFEHLEALGLTGERSLGDDAASSARSRPKVH